jgi:hypothetical protein
MRCIPRFPQARRQLPQQEQEPRQPQGVARTLDLRAQ